MTDFAISSFSLREQPGPLKLTWVDNDGEAVVFPANYPRLMRLAEFPDRAHRYFDVDYVEICQIQIPDAETTEFDEFAQSPSKSGAELLCVPVDIGDLSRSDDVARGDDVAPIQRWLDIAARLGVRFARVNAGSPFVLKDISDPPPQQLVASLQFLGDYAASVGLRLLVENHGGASSDPLWMTSLLDAVGSERIGLLLDVGNFEPLLSVVKADFLGEHVDRHEIDVEPLYAAIQALVPRAELVHAKSHHFRSDDSAGPLDLARALVIIRESGFHGPVTIEYEGSGVDPWLNSIRTLNIARSVFDSKTFGESR